MFTMLADRTPKYSTPRKSQFIELYLALPRFTSHEVGYMPGVINKH